MYFYRQSKSLQMRKYLLPIIIILFFTVTTDKLTAQTNENLFFVFLNSNPDKAEMSELEVEKLHNGHLENIGRLQDEGKLFAAGPFEGGGGMFVLHADNIEEAKSFLKTDPAIVANRFIIEVFPFNIWNGDMCGAREPYTMVTYQFVRLITNSENSEDIAKTIYDNRFFMSNLANNTDQLVVHGQFSNDNDGVLILDVPDTESADKIISKHPSVISGNLNYEIVPLWIAKGTFCE